MKVLAWYIDPNGIENKNTVNYPYPTGIKKCEFNILDTPMVTKKDDTSPNTGWNLINDDAETEYR
jgi:hypothetical protein